MTIAYTYDADGYYAGADEDYGLLPNNATYTSPERLEGFIPRWTGAGWEQVEDHKGKEGYVDGERTTIKDYGPLPDGWSDTPPEPEPPTLEEAVKAKLAEIMRKYSAAFAPLEAVYPAAEREGWPIQEAEARALMADPSAETPVLSALVQLRARGETPADLAHAVLANAAQYRGVYALLTGQQQRMYGEATGLLTVDGMTAAGVAAYPVEYTMPEGM